MVVDVVDWDIGIGTIQDNLFQHAYFLSFCPNALVVLEPQ